MSVFGFLSSIYYDDLVGIIDKFITDDFFCLPGGVLDKFSALERARTHSKCTKRIVITDREQANSTFPKNTPVNFCV